MYIILLCVLTLVHSIPFNKRFRIPQAFNKKTTKYIEENMDPKTSLVESSPSYKFNGFEEVGTGFTSKKVTSSIASQFVCSLCHLQTNL